MRRVVPGLIALALLGAPAQPAEAAVGPAPMQVAAKKVARGTLKVIVTGSGEYTVTGKKVRKTAAVSKAFKLVVGTYRVSAAGASIKPAKVKVRKGKTAKVSVVFPGTAPTPAPTILPLDPPQNVPATQRISTTAAGGQGDQGSEWPVWSPDGTRVAFVSNATNLVPADTNGQLDLFVKTLATGHIQRVSTDANGGQADGMSYDAAWSPDSTRIAFTSKATNLVPGDTNKLADVFIKNLATGAIQMVSSSPFELWAPEDGTRVGSPSGRATPSLGGFLGSTSPAWSADGARIAFDSDASNLVLGDDNNRADIFVKTLATSGIPGMTRVSTSSSGGQGNGASFNPVWSPDGTRVAFESIASNLVQGDTNGAHDVFVKTLGSAALTRVSTDAAGNQALGGVDSGSYRPRWSPDGSKILFTSDATNLVPGDAGGTEEVFVKTLASGAIQRVATTSTGSPPASPSYSDNPMWSPDSTRIVFSSSAANLVPGDSNGIRDIFVKTLANGAIQRVSTDAAGIQSTGGNRGSDAPSWAPDGTRVAFYSDATNLVAGDTNGRHDVFVKRLS